MKNNMIKQLFGLIILGCISSLQAVDMPKWMDSKSDEFIAFKDRSIQQLKDTLSYFKAQLKEYGVKTNKEIKELNVKETVYENHIAGLRSKIKRLQTRDIDEKGSHFYNSHFIPNIFLVRELLFKKQKGKLREMDKDPKVIELLEKLNTQKSIIRWDADGIGLELGNVTLDNDRKYTSGEKYTAREILKMMREGKKATEYTGAYSAYHPSTKPYIKTGFPMLEKYAQKNNDVNIPKYTKPEGEKVTIQDAMRYLRYIRKSMQEILKKELGEDNIESDAEVGTE